MLPVGPRLGQVWSLNMRAGVSTCMCIKPFAMWMEHGKDEQSGGGGDYCLEVSICTLAWKPQIFM